MPALTNAQLESFKRDGFLILQNVFNAEEVAAMQAEADYLLEVILNSSLYHKRRSGRLDWRRTSSGVLNVRKLQPINDMSLLFTNIAADERLTGPLAELMGEAPILMEEKLNYKQPLLEDIPGFEIPQADDYFPVHNDYAYYLAQGYPQSILSSALLLDDCKPNSGPLRVWPGSHLKHLEHEPMANGLQVKPELIDFGGGQDVLAPAGSFVIFHALLVHNSKPNVSGRPRRLMIYSHYPQSFEMPFDIRNGAGRLRESPWERAYLRAVDEGHYLPEFYAPTYD